MADTTSERELTDLLRDRLPDTVVVAKRSDSKPHVKPMFAGVRADASLQLLVYCVTSAGDADSLEMLVEQVAEAVLDSDSFGLVMPVSVTLDAVPPYSKSAADFAVIEVIVNRNLDLIGGVP